MQVSACYREAGLYSVLRAWYRIVHLLLMSVSETQLKLVYNRHDGHTSVYEKYSIKCL